MPTTRRSFLETSAAAAAFTIVPRHVLGQGRQAPSDTVDVACIGVGGMGRNDVRGMAQAGANIVALCDVDDDAAADAFRSYPQARRYKDFRELIERERNVTAILVSTPDHTHTAATLLALRAGKHVRTQKPLTRTIAEARAVREAATQRPRLVTQMGNQGNAGDGVRLMREWVEAGTIGAVREIHYWTNRPIWPQALLRPTEAHNPRPSLDWNLWLGPAPERPYSPAYAPFRWRGWWDFGTGALGDIACHAMDAAYWILNFGYPSRIEAECSELFAESAPRTSRITFTFPERDTRPAVTVVWRDGSLTAPRPPEWPAGEQWPFASDGGQLWVGDQGKLVAGIYADNPRLLNRERMAELTAQPLEQRYPRIQGGVYAEFVRAIQGGGRCGSDFRDHATGLTEMVLLGCLAQRQGGGIDIDPASGRITTTVPAEWVTPQYRRGWSLS
jgi:predicted dehydrogenase